MERNETAALIRGGEAVFGLELGSTRIKAVLIGPHGEVLASGSYDWENRLEQGVWTYHMDYNLELNLFTLYWKDATLSAVCVPSGQFPAAIAMAGQLKLEEVISRELSFSKGIEAFREKSSGREAKVMLRFEQEGSIC